MEWVYLQINKYSLFCINKWNKSNYILDELIEIKLEKNSGN